MSWGKAIWGFADLIPFVGSVSGIPSKFADTKEAVDTTKHAFDYRGGLYELRKVTATRKLAAQFATVATDIATLRMPVG